MDGFDGGEVCLVDGEGGDVNQPVLKGEFFEVALEVLPGEVEIEGGEFSIDALPDFGEEIVALDGGGGGVADEGVDDGAVAAEEGDEVATGVGIPLE